MSPLLELRNVHTSYPIRSGILGRRTGEIKAVAGVSLTVAEGETLGVVGESGCGKSTLARTIVGLERPSQGEVLFDGRDLGSLSMRQWHDVRRDIQMIFQDPYSSLNPRRTVRQIIQAGWEIHPDVVPKREWGSEVSRLLGLVGLDASHADRYPHQFSGGQRQRIGIARALALRPRLIVSDEPVSALDVSVQAQVINLLSDLQQELGLSLILIAHDLSVVRHLSHRVAVMYLGKVVELGSDVQVYDAPQHPYTRALQFAIPDLDPDGDSSRTIVLEGDVPSPANPPSGCVFRTRCWKAQPVCAEVVPLLLEREGRDVAACHFPEPLPTPVSRAS